MFVVHFNQRARFGLPDNKPFTGSIAELETAISKFDLGGTTALYDAILLANSQFVKHATYGRKILLVITDGGDNSSRASMAETLDALVDSGAVVYPIGLFDATNQDQNPGVLARIADVTAENPSSAGGLADTTRICEEIAADVRRQYTLGFAGAEDGQYHEIEVTASDPKRGPLKVHTRPGYFAVKPRGSANRSATKGSESQVGESRRVTRRIVSETLRRRVSLRISAASVSPVRLDTVDARVLRPGR